MKVLNLRSCSQEQINNITEFINGYSIDCKPIINSVNLLVSDKDACKIESNPDFDWYDFNICDLSYDVEFNDDNNSDSKGFEESLDYCKNYIRQYKGTNESYFADYKGGTVSVRCNETGEVVYNEDIK